MSLSSLLLALLLSLSPNGTRRRQARREARRRLAPRRLDVERLEDRTVPTIFTVLNTLDSGPGSLRQAIIDANTAATGTAANPDLIQFAIPASDPDHPDAIKHLYYQDNHAPGVAGAVVAETTATDDSQIADIDPDWRHSWWSIQPASSLPTITEPVVIDGYSQSGASANTLPNGDNAVLRIELNGNTVSATGIGLNLQASASTVQGLVINRGFSGAIVLSGAGSHSVAGNFIGTDVSGTLALGNAFGSVNIGSDNNLIGGTSPADRNLIAGTTTGPHFFSGVGISIFSALGNVIKGNFIGTDASGARALGNGGSGVETYQATNTTIGGTTAGARNVISGNAGDAIMLRVTTGTLVEGNFLGTDVFGVQRLGNGSAGVETRDSSSGNTIGGASSLSGGLLTGAGNLISGNVSGVSLVDEGSNKVFGNFIGTDISGQTALPNVNGVIVQSSDNTIGGANGLGNVMSGNTGDGLLIEGTAQRVVVQGNRIGTDATGTRALGNGSDGVVINEIQNTQITIGGTLPGLGNVISANGVNGVDGEGSGNVIEGNLIGTDITGSHPLGNGRDGVGLTGTNASAGPGTLAANFLLDQGSGQTVFNDAARDTLTGSAGSDWFFAGTADKITDLGALDLAFLFGL